MSTKADCELLRLAAIDDERLTFRELGVLLYLLNKPDLDITTDRLMRSHKGGRDSIGSSLRSLEKKGYVAREIKRNEQGRFSGRYMFATTASVS